MKYLIALFLLLCMSTAIAEGGCPGGQYPQEGPGWRTCVPLPGASQGSQSAAPQPYWVDKWGALAANTDGDLNGASTDQESRTAAVEQAIANCHAIDGKECHNFGAYRNMCMAVASGNGGTRVSGGSSKSEATRNAMHDCSAAGISGCHEYYSGCSLPLRIR
ncbi:DUF4189 domain-containing protein [Luteibacter yeojuensis]|uniref:DUF4189 domain-containing protein n=1 Tax=Luteibacter yeojuensis TaxID=345309 RepID=UPI0009FC08F8